MVASHDRGEHSNVILNSIFSVKPNRFFFLEMIACLEWTFLEKARNSDNATNLNKLKSNSFYKKAFFVLFLPMFTFVFYCNL